MGSEANTLIKYADDSDTNLLVPEHTDCQLDYEFGQIEKWAFKNKMIINNAKTEEMVFRMPHPTKFDMPDPLDGIAQECAAKLLGVMFTGKLSFEDHVDFLLTICFQHVYLFKLLRSQNIPLQQLQLADCLCGLDIVSDYLCTASLGRAAYQTATRTFECFP